MSHLVLIQFNISCYGSSEAHTEPTLETVTAAGAISFVLQLCFFELVFGIFSCCDSFFHMVGSQNELNTTCRGGPQILISTVVAPLVKCGCLTRWTTRKCGLEKQMLLTFSKMLVTHEKDIHNFQDGFGSNAMLLQCAPVQTSNT